MSPGFAQNGPDLVISNVTVSNHTPVVGQYFTISATVRNQGGRTSAETYLRYRASNDSTLNGSDPNFSGGSRDVGALAPGASSVHSASFRIGFAGTKWVGVCISGIKCSDGVRITVVARDTSDEPWLAVHSVVVSPTTPKPGAPFTVSAVVENYGTGTSAPTTLHYMLSHNSYISRSHTELGTDHVRGLVSRATSPESATVSRDVAGTYWVGGCVDPPPRDVRGGKCSATVPITVAEDASPDLTVDGVIVSDTTPRPRARIAVEVTVRNSGDGAAGASTVRWCRSTDSTISTADTCNSTEGVKPLAPGRSFQKIADPVAPNTGTYWYGACTDTVGGESDTTNNCSAGVQVTVMAPDLIVNDVSVSDATPEAGAAFMIEATVRNSGTDAAAATTLRYYRSTDATISTGDTELATDDVEALAADGSSQESAEVSIATGGTWWVGACAAAVSGEGATHNNCSTGVQVTVTAPDLIVDGVRVSDATPGPGIPFTINATVQNPGTEAAAATTLFYYRSTDATITTDDTQIATNPVDALAVDGSSSQNTEVSIANTGRYWVGACAGPVDGETARTNNCSSGVAVTVTAPDLRVDNVSASNTTPGTGVPFTIAARVRNQSVGGATATTLRYVRSTDSTITATDTEIATDPVEALAANGSSQENAEVSIADAGVYWVGACANPVNGEATTDNNCSSGVGVTVIGPPDLTVDSAAVSDATPAPGAAFTIEATARNLGVGAAAVTTLRYFRSDDATITIHDRQLETDAVAKLAANEFSQESAEVSIADTGSYWVGACIDTVSGETAENNNCSAGVQVTVAGPPDLIVARVTVSDFIPEPGASFTINARVRNRGGGAAAATTLRYYLSADDKIRTTDTELTTDEVGELAAAATSDQSAAVSIAEVGEYWVGACIDAVADEVVRTNCSRGPRVSVTAPDLTVDGVSVSQPSGVSVAQSSGARAAQSSVQAGSSFTISATARNSGNGDAAATTLFYYRSTDATITTNDTQLATDPVSALAPDATSAESATVSIANTGNYWVGVCVGTVSGETERDNNCSSGVEVSITAAPVTAPDLRVDGVSVSLSGVEAGASFTINATARNAGNGDAAATTLFYYHSTDATITTGDTQLAADTVDGLAPDGFSSESATVSIADAGEYWVGACADTVDNETTVGNNCSSGVAVTVTAAPVTAPDLTVDGVRVSQSSLEAGVSFTINATARNSGDGDADATTLFYYRSTDNTITATDTELATDPVSALEAGATSAENAAVSIPNTGRYWVGACVRTVSGENEAGNNCSTGVAVSVTAAPVTAPDLTVDGVRVSESSVEAGVSFTINATARNSGNGDAAATTLSYYRSTDATITTNDTQLATDPVSALAPGATSAESAAVSIPNTGRYWVGACVSTASGETERGNNCSTGVAVSVTAAPVTAPDLTVDGVRISQSSVETGASFTINATARNSGNETSDATTLFYYRSTDSTITTNDTELTTDTIDGLAPAGFSAESATVSITDIGEYWVGACVGPADDETTVGNNCSTGVAVTITAVPVTVPDLTVDGVRVSQSSVEVGASFTINATARNSGNKAANATTLSYYRSTDSTITANDTALTTDTVDGLAPGGFSAESATVSITDIGKYWVGACVDTVDDETAVGNNCSSGVQVTITAPALPDLTVDNVGVSNAAPEAYASFTINATVRNLGTKASPETTLRYYRSDDDVIDSADSELVAESVAGLAIDASSTHTAAVAIPDTGNYWVGVCVDTVSEETAANNNCSSGVPVTVAVPAADNDSVAALPTIIQLLLEP